MEVAATDSDTPNMLTVDLSIGGSVLIDAAHALIKTKAQYSVYGSYDGAYLQGDKVFAREARFTDYLLEIDLVLAIHIT